MRPDEERGQKVAIRIAIRTHEILLNARVLLPAVAELLLKKGSILSQFAIDEKLACAEFFCARLGDTYARIVATEPGHSFSLPNAKLFTATCLSFPAPRLFCTVAGTFHTLSSAQLITHTLRGLLGLLHEKSHFIVKRRSQSPNRTMP